MSTTQEMTPVYHVKMDKTSVEPESTRFVVDCMLGKLAKWLRILGYDTLYRAQAEDLELIRIARAEERTLLTRDTALSRARNVRTVLVEAQELTGQLEQVLRCAQPGPRPFSRCPSCNGLLEQAALDTIRGEIPPYVAQTQKRFNRCPGCGRIYWPGTHWDAMRLKLTSLVVLRDPSCDPGDSS